MTERPQLPSLTEALRQLQELAELDEAIDPDRLAIEVGIDSLDLLEWSYELEERYGVTIDEGILDDFDGSETVKQVYDKIVQYVLQTVSDDGDRDAAPGDARTA